MDVELHDPQDLHRAMRLTRAYERRNALSLLALLAPPPHAGRRSAGALPTPPCSTGTVGKVSPAPSSTPTAARPFKRLPPEEMTERRKQGLCYNCDEPYMRGHKCARLLYLEAADYIVDEPAEEEVEAATAEPVT